MSEHGRLSAFERLSIYAGIAALFVGVLLGVAALNPDALPWIADHAGLIGYVALFFVALAVLGMAKALLDALVQGRFLLWCGDRWNRLRYGHERPRVKEVAGALKSFRQELEKLQPEAERSEKRAAAIIGEWKEKVSKFLDANISHDAVTPFSRIATSLDGAAPRDHIRSSCEHHLAFLQKLQEQIEEGYAQVKSSPAPSGKGLPSPQAVVYRIRD